MPKALSTVDEQGAALSRHLLIKEPWPGGRARSYFWVPQRLLRKSKQPPYSPLDLSLILELAQRWKVRTDSTELTSDLPTCVMAFVCPHITHNIHTH